MPTSAWSEFKSVFTVGCTGEKQRLGCVERAEQTRSQAMVPGLADAASYRGWRTGVLIFCLPLPGPRWAAARSHNGTSRPAESPGSGLPQQPLYPAPSSGVDWDEWRGLIILQWTQAGSIKVTRSTLATPSSPQLIAGDSQSWTFSFPRWKECCPEMKEGKWESRFGLSLFATTHVGRKCLVVFCVIKKKIIGVQLLDHIALVSTVQQSESAIAINIFPLFWYFSNLIFSE